MSDVLAEKLGTKVDISRIDIGLPNRIIVDGLQVDDQQKHRMIDSKRLSATIDILPLLSGEISISSIQVFSLNVHLTQADGSSPLNIQFVIDSLSSKEKKKEKKPLNLHIASLVLRNSAVSYDRLDRPKADGGIDLNHIAVNHVSGHILLPKLTDDAIRLKVKKLSMKEVNSGFTLNDLAFELESDKRQASLTNFKMKTSHSMVGIESLSAALDGKYGITSAQADGIKGSIGSKDMVMLLPALNSTDIDLTFNAGAIYDGNTVSVKNMSLSTADNGFSAKLNGTISTDSERLWSVDMNSFHVESEFASRLLTAFGNDNLSPIIAALQYADYTGKANGNRRNIEAEGTLTTALGELKHDSHYADGRLRTSLSTPLLHAGLIPGADFLGDITADINIDADVSNGLEGLTNAHIDADIPLLTMQNMPMRNIVLIADTKGKDADISLSIDDLNIATDMNVTVGSFLSLLHNNDGPCSVNGSIDIKRIYPHVLGLTERWPNEGFSMLADVNIANIKDYMSGTHLSIKDFLMKSNDATYSIENIQLDCAREQGTSNIHIDSDFCQADITGEYDIETLGQSMVNLVTTRMPTLSDIPHYKAQDNNVNFNMTLADATPLQRLLGIDLECYEPLTLHGFLNDRMSIADINLDAPSLSFNGTDYTSEGLHLFTRNDSLIVDGSIGRKAENGGIFSVELHGAAADNKLSSTINFDNGQARHLSGVLHADMSMITNLAGQNILHADISPSYIMMEDDKWEVKPATVTYTDNNLNVSGFSVEHGKQHITIDGKATAEKSDRLVVGLNDVDVAYILDLVNFHSVKFAGNATGTATASALFSSAPDLDADLTVRDFEFTDGGMGTLKVKANYNNEDKQIDLNGKCFNDADEPTTFITGYISPVRKDMTLNVKADGTPLAFLGGFLESFTSDVEGELQGDVTISGPFSAIDLTGEGYADLSLRLTSLNTTYRMNHQHVVLTPGKIALPKDTILDVNGARGYIDGAITHNKLHNWCYDLNVAAQRFLCYDIPTMEGDATFCGKVVGSGTCRITGRPGETVLDIDATPNKGTIITYNVSSPDALQNQEFITWGTAKTSTSADSDTLETAEETHAINGSNVELRSDLRMNFLIRCTTDATLKLLMDMGTGDAISLNGTGVLRATYHNKSGMQIYGNYLVDHGTYSITLQQLLKKEFTFLPEGGITFSGEPFASTLNLHAKYVLNSVPLSDLNIGNSFSNNNVRVNCLMNIGGTAADPKVDFSLELPQASSDVQQMITSLINSEDEMNQQVIYLLAIGRFYNSQNTTSGATSQTSLAMQSFLSGTLSQQLNSAISGILKSDNWNFGANVSPGDEGMYNAEYEGLLSGRLLNNRLLFNGQFGYRDNPNATTSFIGDFDVRYLLTPNGNMQVRVYNQTSDRYFSRNTLNTQGLGIILKHDFTDFTKIFRKKKKSTKTETEKAK